MTTRVYATLADYRAYTGDAATPDARVTALLTMASEDLDGQALVGAVYTTDPQGYPADAGLLDVLMKVTCRQVQFMLDMDDDTGVKQRLDSVKVGSLSFTRAKGVSVGSGMYPIGPRALALLHSSGVLPAAPMINW